MPKVQELGLGSSNLVCVNELSISCRADERVTGSVQIRLICAGGVAIGLLPR
jgi:hypothetical protein